ncbi:DUF2278 family protein [Streptomyces jeddahensis]|uniref:Uncharacterized protein n=1 Tax=Streptomyces jeddahensis TaxID=1716141 RepID=A0A177HWM2_9ACTN|nr:DUF2278 family protein [Streptomyces jeddahensis]OAH14644.1 hypothetical protein STSP_21550 [Streptomyces jeddahensis]
MPLKSYGVLAARAVDRGREGVADDTPHSQIHLVDDAGTHYRAAVNVKSQQAPSELLYLVDENFTHAVTGKLPAAGSSWTDLPSHSGERAYRADTTATLTVVTASRLSQRARSEPRARGSAQTPQYGWKR